MRRDDQAVGIHCPAHLFQRQEAEVGRLVESINQARTPGEKAPLAQDLINTVAALLACDEYSPRQPDCALCRSFASLRTKTATVLLMMGKLEDHGPS